MSELAERGAVWTEDRPAGTVSANNHERPGSEVRRTPVARRRGSAGGAARPAGEARQAPLRLVADGGCLVPEASAQRSIPVRTDAARRPDAARKPGTARQQDTARKPDTVREPEKARKPDAARTPVRLTRRGRLVLTATGVLAIGAVSMVLAAAAQATGHSGVPAGPGKAVTKVLVRPGDSLWSLAETYDPNADTRLIVHDIQQLNSMTTDQVQPGRILWVPRG